MKEKNMALRMFLAVFIGFFVIALLFLWIDKKAGWENERTEKKLKERSCLA